MGDSSLGGSNSFRKGGTYPMGGREPAYCINMKEHANVMALNST